MLLVILLLFTGSIILLFAAIQGKTANEVIKGLIRG